MSDAPQLLLAHHLKPRWKPSEGAKPKPFPTRNRWFESSSVQRRVERTGLIEIGAGLVGF